MPSDSDDKREPAAGYFIQGKSFSPPPLAPGLYIVATPIGNLGDVTVRALATLAGADKIACEDTRVTRRLLERYAIRTRLVSYHDRNGAAQRPRLLAMLDDGAAIALVSDAGTPLVSDPGYKLVREAGQRGIDVFAIPGASSLLAGLVVAGLPTDRFVFEGFLPTKSKARTARIRALAGIDATLVFFESAKRLAACLKNLHDELGDRDAVIAREITKKFEETIRGSLKDLAEGAAGGETLKGEVVLLVGPPGEQVRAAQSLDDALNDALETLSVREAATEIAGLLDLPRRTVYARALELSGKRSRDP
jgi:16S rRNA (cytidine1402-2'-O)-methyltransferase